MLKNNSRNKIYQSVANEIQKIVGERIIKKNKN